MSDFRIRCRQERRGTTLVLEGSVDREELKQLMRLVESVQQPIVIDFLHVRDIPDRLVMSLAELERRHVTLRGLSEHQQKVLRYLSRSSGERFNATVESR